jgi:hypothetical protein
MFSLSPDCKLHLEQTLDTIHTSFPRALTPYLKDYLTSSLVHLGALLPTFSHYYLSSTNTAPSSSEDDNIDLPQLVCPIIDFMGAVARGGKAREWFKGANELIAVVFAYMQMTSDDASIVVLQEMFILMEYHRKKPGLLMRMPLWRKKKKRHIHTVSVSPALIYFQYDYHCWAVRKSEMTTPYSASLTARPPRRQLHSRKSFNR